MHRRHGYIYWYTINKDHLTVLLSMCFAFVFRCFSLSFFVAVVTESLVLSLFTVLYIYISFTLRYYLSVDECYDDAVVEGRTNHVAVTLSFLLSSRTLTTTHVIQCNASS